LTLSSFSDTLCAPSINAGLLTPPVKNVNNAICSRFSRKHPRRTFQYACGSSSFQRVASHRCKSFSLIAAASHMLTIRFSRVGKKKQPSYRLLVSEKSKDPWGKYLEILGTYNPRSTPSAIDLKTDRIKYWLGKGAQTSDTVWNLFVDQKIVEGDKRLKVKISKKRKEKIEKKKQAA
jgi:small subunit ribosomal protein S16